MVGFPWAPTPCCFAPRQAARALRSWTARPPAQGQAGPRLGQPQQLSSPRQQAGCEDAIYRVGIHSNGRENIFVSQTHQPSTPQHSHETAQPLSGKISSRPKHHFVFPHPQTFVCLEEWELSSLVGNSFPRGVSALSNTVFSDDSGASLVAPNRRNPVYEIIFISKCLTVTPKPFSLVLTFRIARRDAALLVLLKLF